MSNDILDSIKATVLGTKSSKIDSDIDNAFKSIEKFSNSSYNNKYVDFVKQYINTDTMNNKDLLKNIQNTTQIQNLEPGNRVGGYAEYDAIVRKISYCKRALEVLVDNILSPDDITKRNIQYVITDPQYENSNDIKALISRCKQVESHIKLEKHIKNIVKTTMCKGDNFVEIIQSPRGENALSILREGSNIVNEVLNMTTRPIEHTLTYETINEHGVVVENEFDAKIMLEYTSFNGALSGLPVNYVGGKPTYTSFNKIDIPGSSNVKDSSKPNFKSKFDASELDKLEPENTGLNIDDIFISVHDPKFVIKLETKRFRRCLGYLVFPKVDGAVVHNSSLMSAPNSTVDVLCMDIIKNVKTSLKASNDDIKLSDDLRSAVLKYLSSIDSNEDLKVRYVPADAMVHWKLQSDANDPYGESIFECVNFDCRLLIALKTAKTVKQLSYATDKRVISVETGLGRDAKATVESLKEGINKKTFNIDNMGGIDTIPSKIPTFETIYLPMRDGKKFVELENQQWGMNPQDDVETLKFMRDNIVANLGVPAPYVGLEENTSNRSLLTVENINFCRTIISYQKELSSFLKEMFEKIIKLYSPDDVDSLNLIEITFPEPKISPYEHQMEYVEQMQRLVQALEEFGIPKEWSKKKYLPNIDWDDIDKYKSDSKLDQESGVEDPDSQTDTMGGMY